MIFNFKKGITHFARLTAALLLCGTALSAAVAQAAPIAPSKLTAVTAKPPSSPTPRIKLFWQDNSNNETHFEIVTFAVDSEDNIITSNTVAAGVTTYTNSGASPGTTYYYKVRACDGADCSDYSNRVAARLISAARVDWSAKYNGPGNNDETAAAIVHEGSAVYAAGSSEEGATSDFIVMKFDADDGDLAWSRTYDRGGDDRVTAMAVDSSDGSVYVTGSSYNTTSGNYEYLTLKYDTNGNPDPGWGTSGAVVFAGGANGIGDNRPVAIALDNSGNVYVTGTSMQYEPKDTGCEYCSDASGLDFATVSYDSSGTQRWLAVYDGFDPYECSGDPDTFDPYECQGNGLDEPKAMKVVSTGGAYDGVYVTGLASVVNSTVSDQDGAALTQRYSLADGSVLSTATYSVQGSLEHPYDLAVNKTTGDFYVVGYIKNNGASSDYLIIEFNSAGQQQWVDKYNGSSSYDDEARAVAVDTDDVYVTGIAMEGASENFITLKYNSSGTRQWKRAFDNSEGGSDRAYAITTRSGFVYVSGTGGTQFTNIKYKDNGEQEWVVRHSEGGYNIARAVTVDDDENAYIVGVSSGYYGYDLVVVRDATLDNDGDGMEDSWEKAHGLNPKKKSDATEDPDKDGLTNHDEYRHGTNPHSQDSDGDGMDDEWEASNGTRAAEPDGAADPDKDGLSNIKEYYYGTNPKRAQQVIYVKAGAGSPQDGTKTRPFDTIEEGLSNAVAGDVVRVSRGDYAPGSDLDLPAGVKLIADGWYKTVIDLGGARQITLAGDNTFRGFNVINPSADRHALRGQNASSLVIANNLIEGDNGAAAGIAAVYLEGSSGRVKNNTVTGGHTGVRVNGLGAATDLTLKNNIIGDTVSALSSTDTDGDDFISAVYNLFNNNVNADPAGTGNVYDQDPRFVDPQNGNYHLRDNSPCRDKGDPAGAYRDRDGSRNDIGADGGPGGSLDENSPRVKIERATENPALTVSFTASASDEWGVAARAWDFDTLAGPQTDSTAQNPVHAYGTCGNYLVSLTVTDHNGHSSTAERLITVGGAGATLDIDAVQATRKGQTVSFSATAAGGSPSGWLWDFGDGEQSADASPKHGYDKAGQYTVIASAIINDCRVADISTVTIVESNSTLVKQQPVAGNSTTPTIFSTPVNGLNNNVSMEIPAGAVNRDTVITVSQISGNLPQLPQDTQYIGVPIDFGPDGIVFSEPVIISIPYDDTIKDPYNLTVCYFDADSGSWTELEIIEVDESNRLIRARTSHFTAIALVGGVPLAPGGLTAGAVSESRIDVSWTDNSSNETGFTLEYGTSSGVYTHSVDLAAGTVSYSHTGLSAGAQYFYRVKAYNATGDSSYSAEASAATPLPGKTLAGSSSGGGGSGNCFIATAAFGSPLAGQVKVLSRFRDEYLLTNSPGSYFVDMYYKYSPPIAEFIAQREWLRRAVRLALYPLVAFGYFMVELGWPAKLALILSLWLSAAWIMRQRKTHWAKARK